MQNSLEALVATEFSKIFLNRQLQQGVKILQPFRDWLYPHPQGATDNLMPCFLVYIMLCDQGLGWIVSHSS